MCLVLLLWYLPPLQSYSHQMGHLHAVEPLADCPGHIMQERGYVRLYKSQSVGVKCQRRSLRRCDHQMTHGLDSGNQRAQFLPLLGMYAPFAFPIPSSAPRTHSWDRNVVLKSGQYTWLNPVKTLYKLLRFWWVNAEVYLSCTYPRLICKFHCLLKLLPTSLEWPTTFFCFSLLSGHGASLWTARPLFVNSRPLLTGDTESKKLPVPKYQ